MKIVESLHSLFRKHRYLRMASYTPCKPSMYEVCKKRDIKSYIFFYDK